jgi:hypothetical protein
MFELEVLRDCVFDSLRVNTPGAFRWNNKVRIDILDELTKRMAMTPLPIRKLDPREVELRGVQEKGAEPVSDDPNVLPDNAPPPRRG